MALITDISISIDSTQFTALIRNLNISQRIDKSHQFRIEFELGSIEGSLDHFLIDKSKEYLGSVVQISIKPIDFLKSFAELHFKGVITNISAQRANRRNGDLILIEGYSPDILIDDTFNCKSFEDSDIKQIFSDVLKPYPQNLLAIKSSPKSTEKFNYIVQYNETNYNFLYRLAAQNGEWFFYDGLKLHLGLDSKDDIELEYGSDLIDFNYSMSVNPVNFSYSTYNYEKVKVFSSSSKSAKVTGLNEIQEKSESKSKGLFTADNNQFYNFRKDNITQDELDKVVKKVKTNKINKSIICTGKSENTGVQIGQVISIKGKNLIMEKGPNYGRYLIVSVNHFCNLEGNYMNTFTAIPANITDNPYTVPQMFPLIDNQTAVVTDVDDPDMLGRIRVRFYWQDQNLQSPWLRVVSTYAGNDIGAFILPEINDEVLVHFEGNNAEKPYVVGSFYNGTAKPDGSWPNAENNNKAIRTRSGHTVVFNDEDGAESITIQDKNNVNSITFDTSSKELQIYSEGDIKIHGDNIELSAKKDITVIADGKVDIKAKKDISLGANGSVKQTASQDLNLEGMNVTIKASMNNKISGLQSELSGSTITTIKGALVKIN